MQLLATQGWQKKVKGFYKKGLERLNTKDLFHHVTQAMILKLEFRLINSSYQHPIKYPWEFLENV